MKIYHIQLPSDLVPSECLNSSFQCFLMAVLRNKPKILPGLFRAEGKISGGVHHSKAAQLGIVIFQRPHQQGNIF